MCGAKTGGPPLEGVDLSRQAVIQGVVLSDGSPVPGTYVRLLDGGGEFTAEVPASVTGQFRFFAGPGRWTVRALAPRGKAAERPVVAALGEVAEVTVTL